ncbi:MAG: hypothetical protein M1823_002451 [Watsoniomyces obsoletus]|nr:MAG: hypothetical protein M1823_002451 [Watsoniomyces obsoletus]
MSAGQPPPSASTATSSSMAHYASYGHPPPLLQPVPAAYPSAQHSFNHYPYANGVTSPPTAAHSSGIPTTASHVPAQLLPLPATNAAVQPPPGAVQAAHGYPQPPHPPHDTTGQVAPPGQRQPRVTATLWEDEGSLCFQVEAKGICVARREDNHMINGTKLLNVAGMTRGRRDGILKSEKLRHVVKIGPMHLKGVWIPFERALDFANREKITPLLYPLFVHNIGALLYQSPGHGRTSAVMAADQQRRRLEQRGPQTPQPPPPGLHHHHSMHAAVGGSQLPGPQASSAAGPGTVAVAPHGGVGRPSLERAHTFPTPPTSAHSVLGMSGSDGGYSWNGSNMAGHGNQPLSVDVGLSNARSMPSTPATTPPGNGLQSTQGYANGAATYDATRPTYSAPPPSSQAQYGAPAVARYGQPLQSGSYIKHEMRPPAARASGSSQEGDRADGKPLDGMMTHGGNTGADGLHHHAQGGEEEAEHEQEAHYHQENQAQAAYEANRASYSYSTGGAVGSLPSEHAHPSPEINGSPNAHPASGRATPRTAYAQQQQQQQQQPQQPPQWNAGYHTPPRAQTTSSNLYSVMSHDQMGKPTNGAPAVGEGYTSQINLPNAMSAGYPSQQQQQQTHPIMNGSTSSSASSNKRMREMEDDGGRNSRPSSRGTVADGEVDGLKRRKTIREDGGLPMIANGLDLGPNQGLNRARSSIVQRRR